MASNSSQRLTSLPESSSSPAPKLFGVSLNNKSPSGTPSWHDFSPSAVSQKRPRASSWGPDGEAPSTSSRPGVDPAATESRMRSGEESLEAAAVVQRVDASGLAGSSKCMKVELGLELRPSRDEANPSSEGQQPWLRISATCPERVFM